VTMNVVGCFFNLFDVDAAKRSFAVIERSIRPA